jgi:cathepsin A (carboxypeptidase C)
VYGPTITRKLIQEIQNGNLPGVNLVGMAIGNGELSAIEQIKSSGPLMYHRGILDKYEWDGMLACCGGDYNQLYSCDVTRFVYLDPAGNAMPLNKSSICSNIFAGIVQRFWQYAIE